MTTKDNTMPQIAPSPPPTLNKELLGVWSAWSRIGNREVVREAVAKGLHVDLAHTFLAARKGIIDPRKIEKWFNAEVFMWVLELLSRKQVFKASHIILNIKLDPNEEFQRIFLHSYDGELRNYLGNHLEKQGKLDVTFIEAWNLLAIIKENEEILFDCNDDVREFNVQIIHDKSLEWKYDIGTRLFFKTYDSLLKPFVTSECAWKYLLKQKHLDLLKLWIHIYYTKNTNTNFSNVNPQTFQQVSCMLVEFTISENMINLICNNEYATYEHREELLWELSKFGVFTELERRDLTKVVSRIAHNENLNSLYDILNLKVSTVDLFRFNEMLIEFCHKNELYMILNYSNINFNLHNDLLANYQSKYLDLIGYLKKQINFCEKHNFHQNILKVSEFFSHNFETSSLILLSIMLFVYPKVDLLQLLRTNQQIVLADFILKAETFHVLLKSLPFLNNIINQSKNLEITYRDLLKSHANIDFNFFNESTDLVNFNTQFLVERYGYKKTHNFMFFLKQCRPSFATDIFLSNNLDKTKIFSKVLKLTARNFLNISITSSCVAFLEMIGENSNRLRIYIKGAKILADSNKFSLEDVEKLLERVMECPASFLEGLEESFVNNCLVPSEYSGLNLIEDIKQYEVAIKFSQVHNLKLPERFLKFCATNNLWLPFLLFIQVYSYPLSIVQRLIQHFTNQKLSEHLLHGISNEVQIDDVLMQERDSRKNYLSRIGVRQSIAGSPDAMHSSASSSYGSPVSTDSFGSGSDLLDIERLELKTDVLQMLIKCHNSVDPPKALVQACYAYKSPIFAVLATSYEPDSVITNWLTWLSVSCGAESKFYNIEGANVTGNTIRDLLKYVLKNSYGKTLHESFQIFLPDNPLRLFICFLNESINLNFNIEKGTEIFTEFSMELKQKKVSCVAMDVDYEMTYLHNKSWIETIACSLLATAIQHNFTSHHSQMLFFKYLHDIRIETFFSSKMPDFLKFYETLNCLIKINYCDIKLDLSLIFDDAMVEELNACLKDLILNKCYECAFSISKIHGLSSDYVITSEWEDKFTKSLHNIDFWDNCDNTFALTQVDPFSAIAFFIKCSEQIIDTTEKYKILSYANKWAYTYNLDQFYDIERKMWMAYFNSRSIEYVSNINHTKMLYSEIKQKLDGLKGDEDKPNLNEEETKHLNDTIEKLLNDCDLWQAIRLAGIFDFKNSDLDVIVLSCNLAEGLLMPYQLTTEQRMLLNRNERLRTFSHRRRRALMTSRRLSSFSSASHSPATTIMPLTDQVDSPFQDTLATLEVLVERVEHGTKILRDIFMTYRIAVNIEKSYQEVFKCTQPTVLLKQALSGDCSNKLEVVHDFCLLFKWSKEQIADLLCDELTTTIRDHLNGKIEPITLWNLNLNSDFHLILQLLVENFSVLGLKLYNHASVFHKIQTDTAEDFRISEINLVIELLIRSHDCFTADCNMEGISTILRKSQTIISLLLTVKSWKLIVRLLTGVARYTEMNYVFHMLRENDQFEFLLRKGSRLDNGLKSALLNYLKKYCPEERELYRMVALHFTLFSEIAQLWEEEARSIVRNLIAISKLEMQNNGLIVETEPYVLFTNTDGTKICLNKAMVNYTHATEYHLQGDKLAKAMSSAKQAELLALQISMLKGLSINSTTICILNLSDIQISSVVSSELSFPQSLILVEAYNEKIDWSTVIFQQYVMNNQLHYLESYLCSFPLTDTLVHDISRKFINLKAISDVNTRNMKEIVSKCASVHTKYRIASELGFTDLVEDLLAGNQLAYLKDTVWKKGYKS